jgi:hypothetical protein
MVSISVACARQWLQKVFINLLRYVFAGDLVGLKQTRSYDESECPNASTFANRVKRA